MLRVREEFYEYDTLEWWPLLSTKERLRKLENLQKNFQEFTPIRDFSVTEPPGVWDTRLDHGLLASVSRLRPAEPPCFQFWDLGLLREEGDLTPKTSQIGLQYHRSASTITLGQEER